MLPAHASPASLRPSMVPCIRLGSGRWCGRAWRQGWASRWRPWTAPNRYRAAASPPPLAASPRLSCWSAPTLWPPCGTKPWTLAAAAAAAAAHVVQQAAGLGRRPHYQRRRPRLFTSAARLVSTAALAAVAARRGLPSAGNRHQHGVVRTVSQQCQRKHHKVHRKFD